MLDAKQTLKNGLKKVFRQRWNIEVDLRNTKTTLGMGVLGCKTLAQQEIRRHSRPKKLE